MAPSIVDDSPAITKPLSISSLKAVNRSVFPDGIKTSGQHPPLYHALRPYSEFPTEIMGPTVWRAEDYANNPERWVHLFSEEEIQELSVAADKFIDDGTPITHISQVCSRIMTRWVIH